MSRASKIQLLIGHSVHLSIPVIFISSHNLHTTNDFSICSQIWNIYSFCQALDFAHISQPWRTIETRFKVSLYTYTLFYKLLFVFKIKTQFFIIGLLKWNATIQFFFVCFLTSTLCSQSLFKPPALYQVGIPGLRKYQNGINVNTIIHKTSRIFQIEWMMQPCVESVEWDDFSNLKAILREIQEAKPDVSNLMFS